ncbi:hypothetical protein K1719_031520 [Acacia pycnantha]|nr:hypothetical protein K1719_031520 [Acacia pycnantha]
MIISEQLCISLLSKCKNLKSVKQIHALLFKTGLHNDPLVAGKFLLHCAVSISDALHYAHRVFLHFPTPDVFMYNTLIRGLAESESPLSSLQLFIQMRRKSTFVPDSFSFAFTLKGVANFRDLKSGMQLHGQSLCFGLNTHIFVGTTLISMYAGCGNLDFAHKVFEETWQPNVVTWNAIVTACFRCGDLEGAEDTFKRMPIRNLTSWNVMLAGYTKAGSCSARESDQMRLVFQSMQMRRSIVSWTSMLAGLAMQGHGEEAIQLFHEMEDSGIRLDGITFISLLYACSHAGLVEQGSAYFSKMQSVYAIEPAMEHYGCMVDLYGRAGKLQKAYDFVCQMPIMPNSIIWRTLLGACSIHGNVELAELVKARLTEMDPNNAGDRVLLSNIYATAGKWKDVANIRRSMAEQSIKKAPGWSMIEIDKVIYSFVAGEKPNEFTDEAHNKLQEIMWRLRAEVGYVPQVRSVLHDIEEEEKEVSVSKHSEKLAVAFGIAKLAKGKMIRIVKNLRVCSDCHTVMKLISKVFKVEIIVRDRSRFHSFQHGFCSCRDYW